MKTVVGASLLLATLALVVSGCSDHSTALVSPADQPAVDPNSLGKGLPREFTAAMAPDWADPNVIIDPGRTEYFDGKMVMKGMLEKILNEATFADGGVDLASGYGVLKLNCELDLVAGEGPFWGHLTLTPKAPDALGGVWEISWRGVAKLGESGWVLPLRGSGIGKGGAIDGMHWFYENLITSADLVVWTGTVHGYIRSR